MSVGGNVGGPTPQKGRSRANCDCREPCFYCGDTVVLWKHQHDHAPIPWRHGGRETVPACDRCHDLKDRRAIDSWPPSAYDAVAAGLSPGGLYVFQMVAAAIVNPDFKYQVALGRDQALELLLACTTPEARIALARTICTGLDIQARWDAE